MGWPVDPPVTRLVHKAKGVNDSGDVSSICRPTRPINMARATWSLRWEVVTCKRCLAKRELEVGGTPAP